MKQLIFITLCALTTIFFSCKKESLAQNESRTLQTMLKNENTNPELTYALINHIAEHLLSEKQYGKLILFLTERVEKNENDFYNSYWLLMCAYAYLAMKAEPFAEYYFDTILQKYPDLLVKGKSIHFLCLQNLIRISKTSEKKISYMSEIISRFPLEINPTELYFRRAVEYQKESEWDNAIRSFTLFVEQSDASTVQIAGEPNAYNKALQLVNFNSSAKDWTFQTLDELESTVKTAIKNYDWRTLNNCRAKANFFSTSWNQDETDIASQQEFSMRSYMRGQKISYNEKLEEGTTPNEAYLRTRGWSEYAPVWYFYFRKVNFPIDPAIHGTWEWAGIYMGERL